jgi:CubicO group peptidase (beta-lactamase class C family)
MKLKVMKAIVLFFLFLGVETSCKNSTTTPLKAEPVKAAVIPEVSFRQLTPEEKNLYTERANALYSNFLNNKAFNGSILIAKNGQILAEKYNGLANFATKEAIDQNTTFHLASVSKTFTAMAILRMVEQKQLSLDDDVRTFFPSFPYAGITVRLLLSHRSGLANYAYVMPKNTYGLYSNDDVVNYFINNKPALSRPINTGFQYCNTNYVLLANIIEKLSGESYSTYMQTNIFSPLGMNSTYVCDRNNIATVPLSYTVGNRPYKVESFDAIYGDKNIYSNVRDLLTWDKVLYGGNFVNPQTAALAYQPTSNEKQTVNNYGLGWRLINKDDVNVVYHTGWWHGNCNIFSRIVQDTTTVIILSNRYNSSVFKSKSTAYAFAKDILGRPRGDMSDVAAGDPNSELEGNGKE